MLWQSFLQELMTFLPLDRYLEEARPQSHAGLQIDCPERTLTVLQAPDLGLQPCKLIHRVHATPPLCPGDHSGPRALNKVSAVRPSALPKGQIIVCLLLWATRLSEAGNRPDYDALPSGQVSEPHSRTEQVPRLFVFRSNFCHLISLRTVSV